jgi:hypothetical protein
MLTMKTYASAAGCETGEHLDRLGAATQLTADRAVLLVHPVRHRGEHVGRLVVAANPCTSRR